MKIDIACGKNKKAGFTGVDIWEGADIVADLEAFPWPFDNESVGEIFCSHYIEHTPDLVAFANELHRILKVGAKAEIIAPYYSSIRAWQDPTHLRAISENTFLYFNKEWRQLNKLDHYPVSADFEIESTYIIDPMWRDKDDDELKFAIRHYINVVSDIRTILTKRMPVSEGTEQSIRQADSLWQAGRFKEAVEICRRIAGHGVRNLSVSLMLAENALQESDSHGAATFFRQALVLDDESLQAHVGLIRALLRGDKHSEAEAHLELLRIKDSEFAELVAMITHENSGLKE